MSNLDNALLIMVNAHRGQTDKGGSPYVLHPLRLMHKLESEDERIVALLHDVVEDSDITLADLKNQGFAPEILQAIECLTKQPGELYVDFILRISRNPLATKVKIEDLQDNLDVKRLHHLSDEDLLRIRKYHQSLNFLHGT